jgi:saccharopine dehydrogenase-like NADP-dependent oxidoreductase
MKKITVLGAGLVGGPMAVDLAKDGDIEVKAVDIRDANLKKLAVHPGIKRWRADLSDPAQVKAVAADADIVISAVPGFLGTATLRTLIESGKDVVDIAFSAENPFDLDEMARQANVTIVVDCGVAPGMSNVLIGHAVENLDSVSTVIIYVGGLPQVRKWPYEYSAVFSPIDVIEEYTRPARLIENGEMVIRPALSETELLNFDGVGTLEAFNSDGLRTIANTITGRNMKEKTLRYPGHVEKMKILRETGFFSADPVHINGHDVRPVDVTARLMFPLWELKSGEGDLTVMKIIVEGRKESKNIQYAYELLDYFDEETQTHSMARTTGYTATVTARLLLKGLYKEKGIIPPEFLGRDPTCVEFLLDGLKKRGIHYRESVQEIK